MTSCPWCGTNYPSFQSNCKNCGGPLPLTREDIAGPPPAEEIITPPPAPRPISDKYVWRLFFTDGLGIVAFVFGLVGAIFSLVGASLTLAILTAFVGIPFLLLGLVFLAIALVVGRRRYDRARQVVKVLQIGESTQGQITDVHQDYAVRVNRQHPWVIRYQFQVNGQNYEGNVRTLNRVGANFQPGTPVCVLYLPNAPQWNAIYPHP